MSNTAARSAKKSRQPAGHFVVGKLSREQAKFLSDCGISEGDEILAPNGFPHGPDIADPPVVEHRRTVRLHPNVAWFVGDIGVLTPREVPHV